MNSKLYAVNKEEIPEDNIFSKVLSGMKSVFNKPLKNKAKKSPPTDGTAQESSPPKDPVSPVESSTSSIIIVNPDADSDLIVIDSDAAQLKTDIPVSLDEFIIDKPEEDMKMDTEEIPEYILYTSNTEVVDENGPDLLEVVDTPLKPEIVEINLQDDGQNDNIDSNDDKVPLVEVIVSDFTNVGVEEAQDAPVLTPEKEEISESTKHHKSKHSPKKKSRKKTKSREEEERHESETDDVSDSFSKSSAEKASPASEDTQNKPRIVLTFRSEKTGLRSTNMKIVSDNDKANEDNSGTSRRSLRNKITLTGLSELLIDENKRETRKKSTVPEKDSDSQQIDDKSIKGANSESDDSAKTPPASRRNKRNTSAAPSDSNSEDSPPLNKESNAIKRSARHRPNEHSDNVLANAIARKEKFYNETSTGGTTRLSRRIKPTAKVLANRELRLGFETQNNARLALMSEIPLPPEEYKVTRSRLKKSPEKNKISIMSAPKTFPDKIKAKKKSFISDDKKISSDEEKHMMMKPGAKCLTVDEINRCILGTSPVEPSVQSQKYDEGLQTKRDDKDCMQEYTEEEREKRRLHKLKKKHLKKLGLTSVTERSKKRSGLPDREVVTDESTMDSTNTEAIVEHLNTRSKSFDFGLLSQKTESFEKLDDLEEPLADVDTKECSGSGDDDFILSEEEVMPKKDRKRKFSSDLEDSLPIVHLSKLSEKNNDGEAFPSVRMTRKRSRMENLSSVEQNANTISKVDMGSNSADEGGDTAANQPEGSSTGQQSCLCNHPSNVHLDPNSVAEVEFCRAVDWIGGRALGCSRVAQSDAPLVRASLRAPYFLPCSMHRQRLELHHCCASCGAFCTQGIFYQCNEGHLFHWECGLPFVSVLVPPTQIDQMLSPTTNSNCTGSSGDGQPSPQKTVQPDVYSASPGCPHCGLVEETMEPVNTDCFKVKVEMKCTAPNVLLPNPRLECVPARMTFHSGANKSTHTHAEEHRKDALIEELDVDLPILPPELISSIVSGIARVQENKEKAVDYEELLVKADTQEKPVFDLLTSICDKENSIEKIMSALEAGEDPQKPILEADGGSCIHVAAREFNLGALHIFKSLGCQLDAFDNKHRTPLMVAIISYDSKMKEIESKKHVIESDKTPAEEDGVKPATSKVDELKEACKKEYYAIVRYLAKAGSDVSLKGPEGVTALHLAAKNSDVSVCAVCLESHSGVTKLLIDQKDDGGWTPLVWASENNNVHVVRFLLDKGADPMIRDSENNVALHWSTVSGCSRSLEALLNAGSCVNVANIYGDTPLHVSARQNHYSCLVLLMARGAQIDMKNNNGHTALDLMEDELSSCHSVLSVNTHLLGIVSTFGRADRIVSNDISNGKETNAVQCVNGVDDQDTFGGFMYITENCFTTDVNIDRKITSMEGCACTGRCGQSDAECACSGISVQSWYEPGGKLVPHFDYEDPPMIFECNDVCSCNKHQCLNRCLSRGSQAVLQVFRCSGGVGGCGGWGVRSARHISRGQFVAEYVGELLASEAAFTRQQDSYLFQLGVKDNVLEDDRELFCIDARRFGNVSRFINHKCSPNLVPVRVYTSHRDLRFPRIAFFACRDIQPGEELGFDYGEKFWSVKGKSFNCQCGADNCRYAGDKLEETEALEEPTDASTSDTHMDEIKDIDDEEI